MKGHSPGKPPGASSQPLARVGPSYRSFESRRIKPPHTAALVTPERSWSPGAQASCHPPSGLACAARRDARAPAQALTLVAVEPNWMQVPARIKPGAYPEAVPGASLAHIRRSTGAAELVSTQVQDCQQPLASLLVKIVPLLTGSGSRRRPSKCCHLQSVTASYSEHHL